MARAALSETTGRERRADAKRRAILDGARTVFLAAGFGAASMDAVAAAAGVAKMTVYRYFPSKEALFAGVIDALCDGIVADGLDAAMAELPLEAALRAFGRRMQAVLFAPDTVELHRIVIAESRRFPELGRRFYRSGPEASVAILERYLRRYAGDPRFAGVEPRDAAEAFMEVLRGNAHLRVLLGVEPTPGKRALAERLDRAVGVIIG